ncbi:MAG TPA: Rap1a/Tai family immunity protein [Geminicoccaceae bacterium]
MRSLSPVLGLVALLGGLPAAAAEVEDFELQTTRDLVALCSTPGGDPLAAEAQQACFGYIAGAIHFYGALVTGGDRFKPIVCPGRELTRQELAALLVAWAEDHPEHLDDLPVDNVLRAAAAAYPCTDDDDPNRRDTP